MRGIISKAIRGLIFLSGVWILFRYFYRRRVRVLMYHGICAEDINLWTQIPVEDFKRQISYLKRHYKAISMSQALEIIKGQKSPPDHSVVITFDDGFLSNKTLAYPVLKENRIPAEIFLTTSFVDRSVRFHGMIRTDYIIGLFRHSKHNLLDLRDQGLDEMRLDDMASRIEAGYHVGNALKRMESDEENRLIGIIEERLGIEMTPEDQQTFGSLSWDDARQLQSEGLITFGAHTVSHEILSRLEPPQLLCEIVDSQKVIEQKLGVPIRHFAYPNGTRADFNDDIKKLVAQYYDCALSTIDGVNRVGADPYEVKRIGIGNDMKLWVFKLELSGVLDFIRGVKRRLWG